MISLPTQLTALYFLLALAIAIFSFLLAVIAKKSTTLDKIQEEFSEKELQLNQKLYETSVIKSKLEILVNSMIEGVFMVDKDFNLLVINPACRQMLKLDVGEKLTIFDIVRSFDGFFAIEEKLAEVFETGDLVKVEEIRLLDKYFQITIIPVEVAEGLPGAGVLIHNKTEEHKLEEKHEEFMAMIVHELRSPLTVVKNIAEMLEKDFARIDENTREEFISQMKNNSADLLTIVNTLLDDTKLDLEGKDIKKTKNSLTNLLQSKIKEYRSLADKKNIKLDLNIKGRVAEFEFDFEKISQVLNNLLSNAIKFTDRGQIVVSMYKKDDCAVVSVADSGVGISDEDKSKLFHKFVQIKNHNSNKSSTGLGLAIVKNIIDSHGGEVWIEDNKPSGAKFIFTLPV